MTLTPLGYRLYFPAPDDTLAIIASNVYGDNSQAKQDLIYEANSGLFLCNDRTIRSGMTLKIPNLP
jgi:phage tail protein X